MFNNEYFPLLLLHFRKLSFQKNCYIKHHHASFTYREFSGKNYLQIHGTAMGTKMASQRMMSTFN